MHDIGKNIVSVVLACNNFEIIDLGVMVPPEKIIETARQEQVDVIGLSGLITPSLDEMIYVAQEMKRQDVKIPLLIGGATTSKAHTAVKIAPEGLDAIIHVNDASKAVNVLSQLLNEKTGPKYKLQIREDYDSFRDKFLDRTSKKSYLSLPAARENKLQLDWENFTPVVPQHLGTHTIEDMDLELLLPYIDWSPFFRSWDLHGKYPNILTDEVVGTQARELFDDAQALLDTIVKEQWLTAKARFGLFPVNSVNDDIEVYADSERSAVLAKWITLRQQLKKRAGEPNLALADFIAPKAHSTIDYMGCFCVTTGFGTDARAKAFEAANDDYNSIMLKALADRLAEAFAEYLHQQVRTHFWGYSPKENLDNDALIGEQYKGIRPAPGYPACPDHLEKKTLWKLLEVEETIGVQLTESLAMWPAASVSGYYFGHPEARYFGLGKIKDDQLLDYCSRRALPEAEGRKWLNPNLT